MDTLVLMNLADIPLIHLKHICYVYLCTEVCYKAVNLFIKLPFVEVQSTFSNKFFVSNMLAVLNTPLLNVFYNML